MRPTALLLGSAPGEAKSAEDEEVSKFVVALRAGPVLKPVGGASPVNGSEGDNGKAGPEGSVLSEFFSWAAEELAATLSLLEKSKCIQEPAALQQALVEVCEHVKALKARANLPEVRPAWELATALEALLKQLTERAGNITVSTLRTIENGLRVLMDLCVQGVRPDLLDKPSVRILAVDDDPVSRYALTAAVKKTFDQPDLAESGPSALAMAKQQRYDVILLDIMMEGMDGFEVCTAIREGALNGSTPVLFVTGLKDFDTRLKFLETSGNDLMGKPFLTLELTLKVFTMVLRARLRDGNRTLENSSAPAATSAPAVSWPCPPKAATPEAEAGARTPALTPMELAPPVFAATEKAGTEPVKDAGNQTRQVSPAFVDYVSVATREMSDQLKGIGRMEANQMRADLLGAMHLRLRSLTRKLDVPELRPAFAVGSSVEGLIHRFKESPKNVTDPALGTAVAGLELLKELCGPGVKPDLAEAPIRILVVDDEPLARRAITGALQMGFSRPISADNGETALALTTEKQFDLVFMDVCMPGMDGFTACKRIHETDANRLTPIVFVTSHSDEAFRAESARCGGSDFVTKPFGFMEVSVKALTYALRGRLQKQATKKPPERNQPN